MHQQGEGRVDSLESLCARLIATHLTECPTLEDIPPSVIGSILDHFGDERPIPEPAPSRHARPRRCPSLVPRTARRPPAQTTAASGGGDSSDESSGEDTGTEKPRLAGARGFDAFAAGRPGGLRGSDVQAVSCAGELGRHGKAAAASSGAGERVLTRRDVGVLNALGAHVARATVDLGGRRARGTAMMEVAHLGAGVTDLCVASAFPRCGSVKAMFAALAGLRVLELRDARGITAAQLAAIPKGLEKLVLHDAPIDSASIKVIAAMPSLVTLSLFDCHGRTGWSSLRRARSIRALNLTRCTVPAAHLDSLLSSLTSIEELCVIYAQGEFSRAGPAPSLPKTTGAILAGRALARLAMLEVGGIPAEDLAWVPLLRSGDPHSTLAGASPPAHPLRSLSLHLRGSSRDACLRLLRNVAASHHLRHLVHLDIHRALLPPDPEGIVSPSVVSLSLAGCYTVKSIINVTAAARGGAAPALERVDVERTGVGRAASHAARVSGIQVVHGDSPDFFQLHTSCPAPSLPGSGARKAWERGFQALSCAMR